MNNEVDYEVGSFAYYHKAEDKPDKRTLISHTHDTLELYYFISGKASFYIEGNDYRLESGDVVIIRDGETHLLKLDNSVPYERIVLNYPKSFLSLIDSQGKLSELYYNRQLGKCSLIKSGSLNIDILPLLLKMEKLSGSDYDKLLEIRVILSYILLELNDCHKACYENNFTGSTDTLGKIIQYINENLTGSLNIDEICEKFYFSKSYINRIFKEKTGSTVWQYIMTKRLILSKGFMDNGIGALKAAELSGFKDYSTFFRQYKKHFGVSPKGDKK